MGGLTTQAAFARRDRADRVAAFRVAANVNREHGDTVRELPDRIVLLDSLVDRESPERAALRIARVLAVLGTDPEAVRAARLEAVDGRGNAWCEPLRDLDGALRGLL